MAAGTPHNYTAVIGPSIGVVCPHTGSSNKRSSRHPPAPVCPSGNRTSVRTGSSLTRSDRCCRLEAQVHSTAARAKLYGNGLTASDRRARLEAQVHSGCKIPDLQVCESTAHVNGQRPSPGQTTGLTRSNASARLESHNRTTNASPKGTTICAKTLQARDLQAAVSPQPHTWTDLVR
jgi:hypothetical protein